MIKPMYVSTTPICLVSAIEKATTVLKLKRQPVVAMLDKVAEEVKISYEIVDTQEIEVSWQMTNFFGDTYYITTKTYEDLKKEKIETELKVVSDLLKISIMKGHPLNVEFVDGHPQISLTDVDSG